MKIEYRAAATGGTFTTVLADESVSTLAAAISGFQLPMTKTPQVAPGYGATNPVTIDMGNAAFRLTFTVDRVHASADAALLFCLNEVAKFPGNVDLKITVGAQVVYLVNCACTEVTPDPHSDQSSKIRYGFVNGNYTTTTP